MMSERAQALAAALDEVGRFYWGLERYNHQPFREAMAKLRALLAEAPPVGGSPQPDGHLTEPKGTSELPEASYLTADNDSHWYVVPVAKRAEWDAWLDIDPDDERAWEPPSFAQAVGGSPSRVEFASWSIR